MTPAQFEALCNARRVAVKGMVDKIATIPSTSTLALVTALPVLFACAELIASAIYACRPVERDP